jgi:hypothetical protein
MSYSTKNYHELGGDKWVIGGALEILPDAEVTGLVTPKAENQPDSTAEDVSGLAADFNVLLSKLKSAGLMAEDPSK